MTIQQELLTAKGTIQALQFLADNDGHDVSTLAAEMAVAEGTARQRLADLDSALLVTTEAELVDGQPRRVYSLTDDGERVADALDTILGSDGASAESTEAEADGE